MTVPVLEARNISKRFPGVVALERVSLCVSPGEILAVVGENGAGKSTLMKILSGALQPDEGEILLDGRRVRFSDPRQALAQGIGIIYQELSVIDTLSVGENVFLGRLPERPGLPGSVDWPRLWRDAARVLERVGVRIDPQWQVRELSVAQKQLVEIARALSQDVRVLILDEPTSSLSLQETERLFEILRGLRAQGVAVIYISHRLEEIFALADRVTVLRDGRVVGTLPIGEATREGLIRMMVGRDLSAYYRAVRSTPGPIRLEVRGLCRSGVLHDVSLRVRGGEIVGLAGLVGAGRTELARCLFGVDPVDRGEIRIDGRLVTIRNPRDAARHGIVLVPEDRKLQGLVLILSVRENVTLPVLAQLGWLGFPSRRAEERITQLFVERLRIRTPSLEQRVMNLSGGNQQKVVLARALATNPKVLILDEPTRGIDVGAKAEVHTLIAELAEAGMGILLISSELPEVLSMSHRVLVMSGGRIVAEFPREEATEEGVLAAATGHQVTV
ncbi:sugar ABC transporter ATP-binding protein [Thermomicrobium sp. CFH 73360]|uniref:sugar ABC transporter ATP-binding protein n=1 Tax=Thermomicrobium sp. CFH 73360 TaxID=2951987 RepID=UPI0020774B1A|nr:sugar ABC transporter ATP-binding protein [Thermomicrobium sp. CFH 73360]MCM8746847.1 sugar ABC transporter ATP-binding protein [Thermomicrobium sp. CFH 73360]